MHFRLRGNNVQIVKSLPDEATGKEKTRPVASANLGTGEIKEKAPATLTPEETLAVKAWLVRHQTIQAQKREIEYRTLADSLTKMAGWVRDADKTVVGEHAEEVLEALRLVKRAIDRRRGAGGEGGQADAQDD
jgi:hypothetical protein